MRKLTATAINIGTINPKIGKTKFDWNVFESESSSLFICNFGNRLLYAQAGDFQEGDDVIIVDNDSGRKLQTVRINKECRNQEELLTYLSNQGYNMSTPRPFQKSTGHKYKPANSYSIKGISFTQ